jgi:hypothetical protein
MDHPVSEEPKIGMAVRVVDREPSPGSATPLVRPGIVLWVLPGKPQAVEGSCDVVIFERDPFAVESRGAAKVLNDVPRLTEGRRFGWVPADAEEFAR